MKRLLALVCLSLIVAACGAPANKNQVATNNSRSPEAKPPEAKSAPGISEADISASEKQIWEAVEKRDYDAFAALLDSNYLEVNRAL